MSEAENAVEWVIDHASSSSDEEGDQVTIPAVRKIPRYNHQKSFELTLHRKIAPKIKNSAVSKLLEKSVIQPGFEQLTSVPAPALSRRALRRERKKDRDRTKGPGWFNMPVKEMTEEIQNDVELLRMRSILDSKHFYKKNDLNHVPKYFQMGTVVEGPADFYNGRIPKSQRKRTLLGELMADAEARALQKKKYKSILISSKHLRTKKESSKTKSEKKKGKQRKKQDK